MYCTICGGDTIEIMGVLGNITWGRCQDCGMDIQVREHKMPDRQMVFRASVKALASATVEVLNAWDDLHHEDESELHLNDWHNGPGRKDCEPCAILTKAYGSIYSESLDEVVVRVSDWAEKLGAS